MAVNPSPLGPKPQFMLASGLPANGYKLFFYAAGSSTKQNTYTDSTGNTANSNPIVLNSLGQPATEIWFTAGESYKAVLAPSNDTDPPASPVWTIDNLEGINDATVTIDQWVTSGVTPTYVSGTQFTVPGDQTSAFHVGRRVKCTVTAGTVYGYISVTAYTSLTTVTVVLDSGSLDSGLSAVQLGLLTRINPSQPNLTDAIFRIFGSSDITKKLAFEVDGLTTATTRTMTVPDKDMTLAGTSDLPKIQEFRLTLTSGTPVTTSDVTGATTVYACPRVGNCIALYDGTNWNIRTSAEFSLALGTLTSGRPYDVFCYDNSGTPTLEFTSWTNDTTRATALTYQDGVLVKTGAATRRYLGTFYTTSTTQTEDSAAKRFLWNYYHRVLRPMERYDATATWSYTTATFRQANAATANQLDYVCGVGEDAVQATLVAGGTNSTGNVFFQIGIGVDSTSSPTGPVGRKQMVENGTVEMASTSYVGLPGAGRHYLTWLEYAEATGTFTWTGTNSPLKSGIIGSVFA
jgi:hypothetical protein